MKWVRECNGYATTDSKYRIAPSPETKGWWWLIEEGYKYNPIKTAKTIKELKKRAEIFSEFLSLQQR